MGRIAVVVAVICASVLASSVVEAGPWVRPLGSGYLKAGVARFSASESDSGQTGIEFSSLSYTLYAELGLPLDSQLVVSAPFVTATNTDAAGEKFTNQTAGDLQIELDRQVFMGSVPVALGFDVRLPLYSKVDYQSPVGIPAEDFDPDKDKVPAVGDGVTALTPKLLVGFSPAELPAWVTAELGYRFRLSDTTDGPFASLNVGSFVWARVLALGAYANADLSAPWDSASTEARESVGVQGYVLVTGWSAVPGLGLNLAAGAVTYARRASRGSDLSASLSYQF